MLRVNKLIHLVAFAARGCKSINKKKVVVVGGKAILLSEGTASNSKYL